MSITTSYVRQPLTSGTGTGVTPTTSGASDGVWTFDAPGTWRLRAVAQMVDDGGTVVPFTGFLKSVLGGAASGSVEELAYSTTDGAGDEQAVVILDTTFDVNEGDTVEVQVKQAGSAETLGGLFGIDLTQIYREETS
jgi:hypothetical protein